LILSHCEYVLNFASAALIVFWSSDRIEPRGTGPAFPLFFHSDVEANVVQISTQLRFM
jgi:hypothetical protein